MGLVTGFSGIISPPNLATNGAFRIHQRNPNSSGTFYPVKSGDYVADCWKISSSTTVDYVECGHHQNGWLRFRGYGKKGQRIDIENVDTTLIGEFINDYSDSNVDLYMTSSARVRNMSGVPISSTSYPKRDSGTGLTTGTTYIDSNTTRSLKPTVRHTKGRGFLEPLIITSLGQDGEFDFYIYDFMELAGAFRDLPKYAPVPYADDLARCQRYYQNGYIELQTRWTRYSSTIAAVNTPIHFGMPMASAPSVSVDITAFYAYLGSGGNNNVDLNTVTTQTGVIDSSAFPSSGGRLSIDTTDSAQRLNLVDNGGVVRATWTAEVV